MRLHECFRVKGSSLCGLKVISDIKVIMARKFIRTINEEEWSATLSRSRNLNDILSHICCF